MPSPIRRFSDVDPKLLTFADPTSGSFGGGQFVTVGIGSDMTHVVIQTPRFQLEGCYAWRFSESDAAKHYLVLRVDGAFAKWIEDIEQQVVTQATTHSVDWFGRVYDRATITSWFTETLKGDDRRLLRLLVPFRGSDCQVAFFNAQGQQIDVDDVPQEGSAATLLEMDGVWFQNRKFGIRWKLSQVKCYQDTVKSYAFVDE